MEGVERTNAVIATPQQRAGFSQRNLYTMDVDRRENRNCRNRMGMNRRMEVDQDSNNNLNGEGGLGSPN